MGRGSWVVGRGSWVVGREYQVLGNVDPRKKGIRCPSGGGGGRIAASPWSGFLVSVIKCFVCETNRYLRDLAAVFSKL